MSKFICLEVIEVGPVYFNAGHIIQFYSSGGVTFLQLSVPGPDGKPFIEVKDTTDRVTQLIEASKPI